MDYPRKQWQEQPVAEEDAAALAEALSVPVAVAEILCRRGIKEASAAEIFLNPRLSSLSDPFDLPGMRAAVDRIWRAIDSKEPITVFGDYDVDGLTSTALMVSLLKSLGADVTPFLPEREQDGYGMSVTTLKRCVDACEPKLIITADCGTNSVDAVAHAATIGIDVVVTDHHEPADDIADAVAVVNPKVAGTEGTKPLAGVGVVFRLCHGLVKEGLSKQRPEVAELDLRDWLDYVAIGTVADIVPLHGDNRILVWHGLNRLNKQLNDGTAKHCWKALAQRAGIKEAIDSYQIGFVIGPRLNAAGRMGSPESALKMLLAEDMDTAASGADFLEKTNSDRRNVEAGIREVAEKTIDAYFDEDKTFGIVAWDRDWHIGINGIVASRLISKFGRPVVVVSVGEDGQGTGSCRSIECLDILSVLDECSDLLVTHGGHKMAAGLTIEEKNLEKFSLKFNEVCSARLKGTDMRAVQDVDAWVTLSEIDDRLFDLLQRMEPYGTGNTAPVLGVRGVSVVGQPKTVGKTGTHLKMTVAAGGRQMDVIGFGLGQLEVPSGSLDMLFRLKDNTFRGRRSLQMHLLDMRESA